MIFQNENAHLKAIKTRSSKSRKIDIFAKLLTHGFFSKIAHFSIFFFQAIQARKMCFMIFQNEKKTLLGNKNNKLKKSKNLHFSKGFNPWFCSKIGRYCIFFFQAIQARQMCFMIFQNEKTHFQLIKKRSTKSRKIDIVPKGLTHGFAQKLAILPCFFFKQYRPGKLVL